MLSGAGASMLLDVDAKQLTRCGDRGQISLSRAAASIFLEVRSTRLSSLLYYVHRDISEICIVHGYSVVSEESELKFSVE